MYNLALSVQACLRATTRVDVAFPVASDDFEVNPGIDAVALTPGGGKVGSLLAEPFGNQLADIAQRQLDSGRIVHLTLSDAEAALYGLPQGGALDSAVVPATQLPDDLWPLLADRQPVCLTLTVDNREIISTTLFTAETIETAGPDAVAAFTSGASTVEPSPDGLIVVLRPTPRLVITGAGPIAEAVRSVAELVGWQVIIEPETSTALGLMAGLAPIDSALIIGHDVESSSRVLAAALDSAAGYIGALGSRKQQQQRADWLAYRGITDLDRVHGPAGFNIGAESPAEIAASIVAEIIATQRGQI
ncbi:MAG: XdhC family protein [Nitriliruptoraceae bacterium]